MQPKYADKKGSGHLDSKVCIEKLKNTIGLTVESIYYGQHPTDVMYG